jgi:hypothetical protein
MGKKIQERMATNPTSRTDCRSGHQVIGRATVRNGVLVALHGILRCPRM